MRLRDMEQPKVMGYQLDRYSLTPIREYIDTARGGDYGADPLPNGLFRMVPSGEVVSLEERNARLRTI